MRSWKNTSQDWHQHRHQIHPHSIRSKQAGSDKLKPLEIRPWLSLFGASVCPVSKAGLVWGLLAGSLGFGSFLWNAVGALPASCPCVPWEQGRLKAMQKCGKGSRSLDTRLGPSVPHLPPVPPRCQHWTSGEFISSCLELISCLNNNYFPKAECSVIRCPSGGHFFPGCEVSWALVTYSSFCLWCPEVTFFLPLRFCPSSSCYYPPQCISVGGKLNL